MIKVYCKFLPFKGYLCMTILWWLVIRTEYKDKIIVYKVDVDKEQELASMFGIRSIPSLLFIPMQGDPKMQVGAMGRMDLENAIKNTLLK